MKYRMTLKKQLDPGALAPLGSHLSPSLDKTKISSIPIFPSPHFFFHLIFLFHQSNGPLTKRKRLFDNYVYIYIYIFRESFNLWRPLLMITFYHQTKTPINFWCRRELNPRFLIQPSEILPVKWLIWQVYIRVKYVWDIKMWSNHSIIQKKEKKKRKKKGR